MDSPLFYTMEYTMGAAALLCVLAGSAVAIYQWAVRRTWNVPR
jgi:hypothetical protein